MRNKQNQGPRVIRRNEALQTIRDEETQRFGRCKMLFIGREPTETQNLLRRLFADQLTYGDERNLRINLGTVFAQNFRRVPAGVFPNPNDEGDVHLTVWNYPYNKENNYLQHLFFKNSMVFIVTFSLTNMYNEETRAGEIQYLKRFLNSKVLIAPTASVILVGTGCADYQAELTAISGTINAQVLAGTMLGVVGGKLPLLYFPVDERTGLNCEELKANIRGLVMRSNFVQAQVPRSLVLSAQRLAEGDRPFVDFETACNELGEVGIESEKNKLIYLTAMSEKAMCVFIENPSSLRKYIVLKAEWLVTACSVPIYSPLQDNVIPFPQNDPELANDFGVFTARNELTQRLMFAVWREQGYSDAERDFFEDLLKRTGMVSEIAGRGNLVRYLTPCVYPNDEVGGDIDNRIPQFTGPHFVLDFTGQYDQNAAGNNTYVKYLPLGFFERLMITFAFVSKSIGQVMEPVIAYKKAMLSFGAGLSFIATLESDENGLSASIRFRTFEGTTKANCLLIAQRVYAIALGLKKENYAGHPERANLCMNLLLPSENNLYCDAFRLRDEHRRGVEHQFMPAWNSPVAVSVADYEAWFENRPYTASLVSDDDDYRPVERTRVQIPGGKSYHIFLAYNTATALDVMQRIFRNLSLIGFTCFFDRGGGQPNEMAAEDYVNQVGNSMCYALLLSEGVFENPIILQELAVVMERGIPVLFLDHPDTNNMGYLTKVDYIRSAPAAFRPLFQNFQSIPLPSKRYLLEAITQKIGRKLREIINNAAQ